MRRFSEIIEDLELRDLPLQGGSFTWRDDLNNQSHSRLDRFLVSDEWEGHFTGVVQCVLPKPILDHFPILLDGEARRASRIRCRLDGKVKINGSWLIEENEIRVGVVNEFKVLLFEEGGDPTLVVCLLQGEVEELRDFRPISLVGGLYKWLAKMLANRLKPVVGKVVFKAQNAFQWAVMCKLDIEKAYDHVDWSFLLSVMGMMGFGEKWLRWMRWCISTTSFSVLVNETSSACKARGRGGERAQVSHLLFANDTLVFCGASQDQMTYLSWILKWFEAISGLRINLDKSELILVGGVENIEALVAELGCKVGSLPSSYLGLPLGAPHRSMAVWDGVEKRFQKRLARQKKRGAGGESLGEQGGWCSKEVRGGVKFWKDRWGGDSPLRVSFPTLFALAIFKDAWVKDVWSSTKGGGIGARTSLDLSMIGMWMRCTCFSKPYGKRV
ncbi:hypothetical protein AAG906_004598 [Vitis piasezkii]